MLKIMSGTSRQIGLLVPLADNTDVTFGPLRQLGLSSCQLSCWRSHILNDEMVNAVLDTVSRDAIGISSVWAGYSGPAVWDFYDGPSTVGLVPEGYRSRRVDELKRCAEFAQKLGVSSITTHVGFLPENPADPLFDEVVAAIAEVASYCEGLGIDFCFETGQETPVVLLRVIEMLGAANLGINLDPANLIMYGKANPVDALDILGPYVKGVHVKDGKYPTDGRHLGEETPVGEGRVDFSRLTSRLVCEFGYEGPWTIEREIQGDEQQRDIRQAVQCLTCCLESLPMGGSSDGA